MRYFRIREELRRFSRELKQEMGGFPDRTKIREALVALGRFHRIEAMDEQELVNFFAQKPLVGVDGSSNTYGGRYPNWIGFLQALAKSTKKVDGTGEILLSDLFTPLRSADRERMEAWKRSVEPDDLSVEEQAAFRCLKAILAALEVDAAIMAVERFHPKVLLMDGGFLRYEKWAGPAFRKLKQLALEKETILLGIIEEIGSIDVVRLVRQGAEIPSFFSLVRDRELFYGLLNPGEYFDLDPRYAFKPEGDAKEKTYGTVFARLSQHPQAIAVDYLMEQRESIHAAMRLLYQITPNGSRGIPQWLDIVDAEVRIRHRDVKALLESHLEAGLYERFFHPMREQRAL